MKNSSSVIFVSSALQQPRHQKRIDLLRTVANVKIFYFERRKYVGNLRGYEVGAINVGLVKDSDYSGRFVALARLWWLIFRSDSSFAYCTGVDSSFVALLAGKRVVLELGDLHQVDGKGKYFAWLDWLLIRMLSGLVLTSPSFLNQFYGVRFPGFISKILIIENKLPIGVRDAIEVFRSKLVSGIAGPKVKIGVIGNFTNRLPLQLLRDIVGSRTDLEVHIFGEGLRDVFESIDRCVYHGPFRNPDDLASIYEVIDISYVVYDTSNNNVRLALPNKLYESIAFLRPILCSRGTALSEIVDGYGIGASVDLSFQDVLRGIDFLIQNYSTCQNSMRSLPEVCYLDYESVNILSFLR